MNLYSLLGIEKEKPTVFTFDIFPFKEHEYTEFWKFVVERQYIWFRRFVLNKPYPWTRDPILQKYRFTNVYRELDKGTIYIIEKLKPIQKDRRNVLFNVFVYRIYNKHRFFEKVNDGRPLDIDEFDVYEFINSLDKVIENEESVYSNAYLTYPVVVKPDYRPHEKHVQHAFLIDWFRERIDEFLDTIDSAEDPREFMNLFMSIKGIKDFISYEFFTDLTYFKFFKQGWTDNDFVNIGKGARWGLNIMVFNKDSNDFLMKPEEYEYLAYKLRDEMERALKDLDLYEVWMTIYYKDAFTNVPFLSVRNIEHSLCEFRKYYRLKYYKKGRKRYYTPPRR